MSRRPVFSSAAIVGMVAAWRFASEVERRRRMAPAVDVPTVTITRIDGSVRRVPADGARVVRRPGSAAVAIAWLTLALVGVAGTTFALTSPMHVLAWPIAIVGLGLVVAARIATR